MEIVHFFFIFVAIELFESNWQKSSTLYGMLENNFLVYKKNIFLYFILHISFFYSLYLSISSNNFGFWMSSILALKFFDIIFKLSITKNVSPLSSQVLIACVMIDERAAQLSTNPGNNNKLISY